jgi:hypothetical protein
MRVILGEYLGILSPPRYFYWSEMGVLVPKKYPKGLE